MLLKLKEDWKKKTKIIFLKEENKVSWFSNWKKNFSSFEKNLPQKIERRIWEQRRIWEENRPPGLGLLLRNPKIFFKNVTIDDWIMGRKEKFVNFKDETAVDIFKMESLYQNQRKNIHQN